VVFSPLWAFTIDDGGHFTLSCPISHPLSLWCPLGTICSGFLASMGVHCRWRWPLYFVLSLIAPSPSDVLSGRYNVVFSPLWAFTVDDGGHFTVSCHLSHSLSFWCPLGTIYCGFLASMGVHCRWRWPLHYVLPRLILSSWFYLGTICSGCLASMGVHCRWQWPILS
jgi:hypothetical protein